MFAFHASPIAASSGLAVAPKYRSGTSPLPPDPLPCTRRSLEGSTPQWATNEPTFLSRFLVCRVLAAGGAVLLHLGPVRVQALVLGLDVVAPLAVVAGQRDLVAHLLLLTQESR